MIAGLSRDVATRVSGAAPLILTLLAATALGLAGCHRSAFPEKGTYPEQLYIARCGQCHKPYDPRSMTAAMWRVKMRVMAETIAASGRKPLTPAERKTITDYLTRNAGSD